MEMGIIISPYLFVQFQNSLNKELLVLALSLPSAAA
jgi:hypothetical protein